MNVVLSRLVLRRNPLKIMIKKILYILTISVLTTFSTSLRAEKVPDMDSVNFEESASSLVAEQLQRNRIIEQAFKHIGARYRHGTAGPRTFDCSGFTSYVFGKENISLSRCSRTQYTQGTAVHGIDNLRRGDLVFFSGRRISRTVGHVGIVVDVAEDGKSFTFVHASCSGVKVDKSTSSYYIRRYIGARRVI